MKATSVGRTIRWARKRAGMTQHDLARALGMPQPSVARIERGVVIPRTTTLIAILHATGHRLAVEPLDPEAADPETIGRWVANQPPWRTRQALGPVPKDRRTSPLHFLRRLRQFTVPFVLIGELAEVAHGAPATRKIPRVVEVCHAVTEVGRERLALALDDLGAAGAKGPEIKTDAGRLILRTVTAAGDYEMLVRASVRMPVDSGLLVQVAAIEDLVRIREAAGSPEDRSAAAVLRAVADAVAD